MMDGMKGVKRESAPFGARRLSSPVAILTAAFLLLLAIPGVAASGHHFVISNLRPETPNPFGGVAGHIGLVSGEYQTILADVRNDGASSGSAYCELGVYTRQTVNNWYGRKLLSFIQPTSNCVPEEENVDTFWVNLKAAEKVALPFKIKAPLVGGLGTFLSGGSYDFGIHAQCFAQCAKFGDVGQHSYAVMPAVIGSPQLAKPAETCTDRILNQDETDIDCGGVCGACTAAGNICKAASDCDASRGLVCVGYPSSGLSRCASQTPTGSPPPTQLLPPGYTPPPPATVPNGTLSPSNPGPGAPPVCEQGLCGPLPPAPGNESAKPGQTGDLGIVITLAIGALVVFGLIAIIIALKR